MEIQTDDPNDANLLATILQFDTNNEIQELHDYIINKQFSADQVIPAIQYLLSLGRIRTAYLLSLMIDKTERRDVYVSLSLAAGGLLFGNREDEARGLNMLQIQIDNLSIEQQNFIGDWITLPVINSLFSGLLLCDQGEQDAFLTNTNNLNFMVRVLEILKASIPKFRPMFDWNVPIPDLTLTEMRRRGREQSRLINHPLPPPWVPRQKRRVLVFERERYHITMDVKDPNLHPTNTSLLSMVGPLMVDAMNDYGWDAQLCPIFSTQFRHIVDWVPYIIETCRQQQPEIVCLDMDPAIPTTQKEFIDHDPAIHHFRQEFLAMLAQLRQEHPHLKVVGMFRDSWKLNKEKFMEICSLLDVVWDPFMPSRDRWNHPSLARKVLFYQFFHPGGPGTTDPPLALAMAFTGTINFGNWPRFFWLGAGKYMNLPIKRDIPEELDKGLHVLEEYGRYTRRLGDLTWCFNHVMRRDYRATNVTGRAFEIQYSGALLVQEYTHEMHYHFVAGVHYLEVSSIAELVAVMRFIKEHPDDAENIRRCGHAFAHERYSGEKLIGYLDHRLYFY